MNETAHTDLIAEAITEAFGERCPDYDKDCWCCKSWQQYDDMLAALKEANAFILAPAEDIKERVLSDIRAAISKATPPEGTRT